MKSYYKETKHYNTKINTIYLGFLFLVFTFEQHYVKSNNYRYSVMIIFTNWVREEQNQNKCGPYKLLLNIYIG